MAAYSSEWGQRITQMNYLLQLSWSTSENSILLGTPVNRARDASGGYANYMEDLQCLVDAPVTSRQLNNLFAWSWEGHEWRDFELVLGRSFRRTEAGVLHLSR
jgi:hypothetical protein